MLRALRRLEHLESKVVVGGPALHPWDLRADGRAVTDWGGHAFIQSDGEGVSAFLDRVQRAIARPVIWLSEQDQRL